MNTLEAIKNRTSYRGAFIPAPVPRGDLRRIMEAGLAAPSGCNTQTTSLICADDPKVLEKVRGITEIAHTAPALIFVLTQRLPAYADEYFNVQDYSAAIENMLLAIVSLGYQSCWYEGQLTDEHKIGREIAKALGVPEGYELICMLPVGKAAQELNFVGKKPFGERAWYNGFQKTE
jgi:nitroreductase